MVPECHRGHAAEAAAPSTLDPTVRGIAPDLMTFLGGFADRSIGSVGRRALWIPENDTGLDEANPRREGLRLWSPAAHPDRQTRSITEVFGMILEHFDLPKTMPGAPGNAPPVGQGLLPPPCQGDTPLPHLPEGPPAPHLPLPRGHPLLSSPFQGDTPSFPPPSRGR